MLRTHLATAVCDHPITCTLKRIFDSLEQAREAATEFIADEHLDESMKVLRHGIGLRPAEPDSPTVVGGSRLGGEPDLSAGIDWPRPDPGALPYAFICQIDCAEAHALGELAADLSDHGRILVFYDVQLGENGDAARAAHVLWHDDSWSPQERSVEAVVNVQWTPLADWFPQDTNRKSAVIVTHNSWRTRLPHSA